MNKRRAIQFREVVTLALAALSANRLRSILTIIGIAIGTFSVVGVMTALSAIRRSIDSNLSFLGANVFQIQREPTIRLGGAGVEWWKRPPIDPRQAQAFKAAMEEDGIPVAIFSVDGGERVRFGDQKTGGTVRVVGSNENYLMTNKYELAYGRNISPADVEFNRAVIILGEDVRDRIFPNLDPIGQQVVTDGQRYTVIGVLEPKGKIFGQSMDNIVIIPISRFVANNWGRWRSMNIAVQAPSTIAMPATQDTAIGRMRVVRGLEPEDPNDFEISSNDALTDAFAKIAVVVGSAGLIVSAIALLCAGVGIMNIMLVSVTERTREIGLRKSLGARRRDILTQFLLEAVFLSEIGAVIGIVLGIGLGNRVAASIGVGMIVPWFWIGTALAVCSAIGIFFGFAPALRAARLNPVEALRYE